jgi:hypothetical protein
MIRKSCNPAELPTQTRTARTQHNLAIVDVAKSSTRQMAFHGNKGSVTFIDNLFA